MLLIGNPSYALSIFRGVVTMCFLSAANSSMTSLELLVLRTFHDLSFCCISPNLQGSGIRRVVHIE
jgi:hypothetical protein